MSWDILTYSFVNQECRFKVPPKLTLQKYTILLHLPNVQTKNDHLEFASILYDELTLNKR